MQLKSFHKLPFFVKSLLVNYPSSKRLSYFWNGGSMLGFILVFQVFTGLLLVFFYSPSVLLAFDSIDYLARQVWFGFFPRVVHLVGASLFSLFLYFHIARNLFVGSYFLVGPW